MVNNNERRSKGEKLWTIEMKKPNRIKLKNSMKKKNNNKIETFDELDI